jgi:hypothetical protein
MVVGVDQSRQDQVASQVEHFVARLRKFTGRTDLFDEPVPHKKTTLGDFPLVVIHGDKDRGVLYKKGAHKMRKG